ncbi:MAG: hypothetical protein FJ109_03845 [Deltaproteobacteria bacterium]|nr:hypothetical protein [Deltaproteobacteria bacterium]
MQEEPSTTTVQADTGSIGLAVAGLQILREFKLEQLGAEDLITACGLGRAQVYRVAAQMRAFAKNRPGPGRPRQAAPVEPTGLWGTRLALAEAIREWLYEHPGAVSRHNGRMTYSDDFRAFVVDLAAPGGLAADLTHEQQAEAFGIPKTTLLGWWSRGRLPKEAEATQSTPPAADDASQPASATAVETTQPAETAQTAETASAPDSDAIPSAAVATADAAPFSPDTASFAPESVSVTAHDASQPSPAAASDTTPSSPTAAEDTGVPSATSPDASTSEPSVQDSTTAPATQPPSRSPVDESVRLPASEWAVLAAQVLTLWEKKPLNPDSVSGNLGPWTEGQMVGYGYSDQPCKEGDDELRVS